MSFSNREKTHFKDLRRGNHVNSHLQSSFNKHGEEAFKFEQVEIIDGPYDKTIYFAKENALMEELKLKGIKLYNIALAQGGWTFHTHERKAEIAAKVSESLRKTFGAMTSEERKERFSYWSEDKHYPDDARAQISAKMIGVKKTDETRKRMKEAQASMPEEFQAQRRANMQAIGKKAKGRAPTNKGQKASEETRRKQSLAKLGKPMSQANRDLRKGKPAPNRIPVKVEGLEFESMAAAAKHFGKSMTWIYKRVSHD